MMRCQALKSYEEVKTEMKNVKAQVVAALFGVGVIFPLRARADQWAPTNIPATVAGLKTAASKAARSNQAKPVLVSAAGGGSCIISNRGVMKVYGFWYFGGKDWQEDETAHYSIPMEAWNKAHKSMLEAIRRLKATGYSIVEAHILGDEENISGGSGSIVTKNQVGSLDPNGECYQYVIYYTVSLKTLSQLCSK